MVIYFPSQTPISSYSESTGVLMWHLALRRVGSAKVDKNGQRINYILSLVPWLKVLSKNGGVSATFWEEEFELCSRILWTKTKHFNEKDQERFSFSAVNEQNEKNCQIREEFPVHCPAELLQFFPDHH